MRAKQRKNKSQLTREQRVAKALQFIVEYSKFNGFNPNMREIGEHVELLSTASVHLLLSDMQNEELIKFKKGIARSIVVLPKGMNLIAP